MLARAISSPLAVRLRYLGAIVAVGMLWSPSIAASRRMDCSQTIDCRNRNQASVCVDGSCVSCVEDPSQCSYYEDLDEPFCDYESGMCWESTDCIDFGGKVGNACEEACTSCADGCADDCPPTMYCDGGSNMCIPIE